jgi:glycosyltransferase involved in cell wall biosynthesis
MPQVSVIIPTYNGERFLAETLESVFNQTFQDYEIIVVNDGSSDNTAQLLRPYLSRIRYIEQPNQGVAGARQRGFELAQGQFIAFLDQDDVLLPDKLRLQLACFAEYPETSIVHSGWRLIDAVGHKLSDILPWQDAPNLDVLSWLRRMPVLLSAMLFQREALAAVGVDSRFQQACDVELIQRLVLAGYQTVWLRQVTVLYRQHDRNDSLNTLVQAREVCQVQEQLFARADLPTEVRAIEKECRYYTLVWLAWRFYYTNRLPEMAAYLERAICYRPQTWTEAIMQWIDKFNQYDLEYGRAFDLETLTQSAEWQRLIQKLLIQQLDQMRQSHLRQSHRPRISP